MQVSALGLQPCHKGIEPVGRGAVRGITCRPDCACTAHHQAEIVKSAEQVLCALQCCD